MIIRLTALLFVAGLLSACKSIDGTYRPGCIAYEGSEIVLQDGNFTKNRFTDQVALDDDGQVVDPFPDYPQEGGYRVDRQFLYLTFEHDGSTETMHIDEHGGRIVLLTESEFDHLRQGGRPDDCVLAREDAKPQ